MRRRLVASVVLTCLVCFGATGLALGMGWSPKLGLDLQGGLSVVYQPAKKVSTATLQTVANIMTDRVNGLGVSQPNITTQGGNVVVQIPGVKDARNVLSIIGRTAQLFFRPVLCAIPPFSPPAKTKASAVPYVTPPACPSAYTYSSADYDTSTSNFVPPGLYPAGASYKTTPINDDDPTKNIILPVAPGAADRYVLGPAVINGQKITGGIIKDAYSQLSTTEGWVVTIPLTSKGGPLFNALATKYYHSLVADDLDGVVISAPVIEDTNFNGTLQVSGGNPGFTSQTAGALALELKYGSLPVTLIPLTTETVSPSLGHNSLRAGLLAGLLGLLLVMGYTVYYYRALGIVVILGLITTAAFLYGLISGLGVSSLGLTLDLSGVTGLIVSVGITVDSYIVYFERLKDDVRAGRSIRASVDRGFKSAYRTILSADAVSFIGALVLWILSVGAVRGFAFMLGISTLTDVVTAYVFTRPFVILLGRNRVFTEARHLGVARGLAAPLETP